MSGASFAGGTNDCHVLLRCAKGGSKHLEAAGTTTADCDKCSNQQARLEMTCQKDISMVASPVTVA